VRSMIYEVRSMIYEFRDSGINNLALDIEF